MANWKACLKGIFDWAPPNAGVAKITNARVPIDQDNVILRGGKGVGTGVANILRFIAPMDLALSSVEATPARMAIKYADQSITVDLAQGVKTFKDLLKKIDPRGDLLVKGEQSPYNAALEAEVKDFFWGKKTIEQLSPEAAAFAPLKADFINYMNNTPKFQKFVSKIKGGKRRDSKYVFNLNEDIMTPLMSGLVTKANPHAAAFDMQTITAKQVYLKILSGKSPAEISFSDFYRAAYPQLIRKHFFDQAIDVSHQAMAKMKNPFERRYLEGLVNKMAGKKRPVEKVVDAWVDQVRQSFGAAPLEFSPSARWASGITRGFYRGIMWMNPGMAILNLTQNINTMAKYGALRTLKGVTALGSKEGRMLATEARMLGSLDKVFRDTPGVFDKLDDLGFFMFNQAEFLNRGIAFHAGLSEWMEKRGIKTLQDFIGLNKTNNKAFNEGMFAGINAANETQFLYSAVQQSPLLSSSIGRLVGGQFTSFPIKQTEFLIKGIRQSPALFTTRYLMYTGMASAFAHYGLGVAIGRELGGLGSLPIAMDFAAQGKTDEAIYMGTTGLVKYLPDRFSIGRGMTPFNSLLLDTLALATSPDDPNIAWARWGRSMMSTVPAGLALRRAAEASMAGFVEEGRRFEPGSPGAGKIGSALEGTSVIPVLSRITGSYFKPFSYTGRFAQEESPKELLALAARTFRGNLEILSGRILMGKLYNVFNHKVCCGVLTDENDIITQTPPYLRHFLGRPIDDIRRSKRFSVTLIDGLIEGEFFDRTAKSQKK